MRFDPNAIDYSGLSANDLTKADFTPEQLAILDIDGWVLRFATNGFDRYKFQPKMALVFAGFSIAWLVLTFVSAANSGNDVGWITGVLSWLILGIGFTLLAIVFFRSSVIRRLRLLKFISDNHISYAATSQIPNGPIMFNDGHSKKVTGELTFKDGSALATYKYVTGYGKNAQTHLLDFAVTRLSRAVPHLYLNGIANRISATVIGYDAQQLNLEGDFNKKFSLYAPPGYQVDALQIITPDVMSALIEVGTDYDYELVGDHLYMYSAAGVAESEATLRKMLTALAVISDQLNKQTATYSDSRAGNVASGKVAVQGATLKPRKLTGLALSIIFAGIIGFYVFLPWFDQAVSQGFEGFVALSITGVMVIIILIHLKSSKEKD